MASPEDDFKSVLKRFKNHLTQKELDDFQCTSLQDVYRLIGKLQAEQRTEKRMMNLKRMKGFLEGMNELGKVINVFSNSSALVAAVWGPVKFLLQVRLTFFIQSDRGSLPTDMHFPKSHRFVPALWYRSNHFLRIDRQHLD